MSDIQAFPGWHQEGQSGMNVWAEGMTLRDYFAGQALTGFVPNVSDEEMKELAKKIKGGKFIAGACYTLADAMLSARSKK